MAYFWFLIYSAISMTTFQIKNIGILFVIYDLVLMKFILNLSNQLYIVINKI